MLPLIHAIAITMPILPSSRADAVRSAGATTTRVTAAVNLTGTPGDDILQGTELDDTLYGGEGNDTLYGGAGNDRLEGDDGNDLLYGGDGMDWLEGGLGDDRLEGGEGNDILQDAGGHNMLYGGAGNDTLAMQYTGSSGVLDGGEGDDFLLGVGGTDLFGGTGNDTIRILQRSDVATRSVVDGGDGDDTIEIDSLSWARGQTMLAGGAGNDTYVLSGSGPTDGVAPAVVTDFARGDRIDVRKLFYIRDGNDNPFADGRVRLLASGADTLLQQRSQADPAVYETLLMLRGVAPGQLGGADFVDGFDPHAPATGLTLTGTDGIDVLRGGRLNDTLRGLGGNDTLDGREGDDLLEGGDGADQLDGGEGNDILRGGNGNDELRSTGVGVNLLDGGAGDDRISGGGGDDTLLGGAGNDWLVAEGGFAVNAARTVVLDGGDGDDILNFRLGPGPVTVKASGGAGADRFVFTRTGVDIVILDLDATDRLDLTAWLPYNLVGNPFGAAGYLKAVQEGADLRLYADLDGSGGRQYGFEPVARLANTALASLGTAHFVNGYDPTGSDRGLVLAGTAGNDVLKGGDADDRLDGGAGDDELSGGHGDDLLEGGDGDDLLVDSSGANVLRGGAGNDRLWSAGVGLAGDKGGSLLDGGAGNDDLQVGGNVARALGGAGNDMIYIDPRYLNSPNTELVVDAGDGDDRITVNGQYEATRKVTITGGAGVDRYDFHNPGSVLDVTITDFQTGAGGDVIDLFATFGYLQANPFGPAGYARLVQQGSSTLLQVDRDGAAGAEGFTTWAVFANTSVAAFTAANFTEGVRPDGSRTGLSIDGGAGPDWIEGGRLDDILRGGDGNDELIGMGGDDVLEGGDGDDGIAGGLGNDRLDGGAGKDTLNGNEGDDHLLGGAGIDTLYGNEGNDVLDGGEGNDALIGASGDDLLHGGAGRDTAYYFNGRDAYALRPLEDGGWSVTDSRAGRDGRDLLDGVERLRFTDGAVALDIDGVAAQAYRIYRAAFDRTPDETGLGYWIAAFDRGNSVQAVAAGFTGSQEFRDLYGAAPSNAEVVTLLYRNVLDRTPDAGGYAFWLDVLDSKRDDVAGVLASFSDSAENVAAVAPLIGQGIAYQPWGG